MSFLKTHARLISLNVISLIVFVIVADSVIEGGFRFFDSRTLEFMNVIRVDAVTNIMLGISNALSPLYLMVASLGVLLLCIFYKKKALGFFFILSMVLSIVSGTILKLYFGIGRPEPTILSVFGPSFPSSHAMTAAVFFLTLLYLVEHKIRDRMLSSIFAVLSLSLIFFTGLSRIYLGVHWASDVVGGFALGFFCTTLSLIFLKLYEKRENMKVV